MMSAMDSGDALLFLNPQSGCSVESAEKVANMILSSVMTFTNRMRLARSLCCFGIPKKGSLSWLMCSVSENNHRE